MYSCITKDSETEALLKCSAVHFLTLSSKHWTITDKLVSIIDTTNVRTSNLRFWVFAKLVGLFKPPNLHDNFFHWRITKLPLKSIERVYLFNYCKLDSENTNFCHSFCQLSWIVLWVRNGFANIDDVSDVMKVRRRFDGFAQAFQGWKTILCKLFQ